MIEILEIVSFDIDWVVASNRYFIVDQNFLHQLYVNPNGPGDECFFEFFKAFSSSSKVIGWLSSLLSSSPSSFTFIF